MKRLTTAAAAGTALFLLPTIAFGEEAAKIATAEFMANNVWMMICTALVFIMNLGFAAVESGLSRSKNTVNILFKNTVIPILGLLTYAGWGFNMMYPGEFNGWFGFAGAGLALPENGLTSDYAASHGYTYWTDFLFQGMFAATCATIVSGAVAERIKLWSFIAFSVLFVGFVYPIAGSWKWGGGWLQEAGFYDFAGSTLVHSVGGWGALMGAMILGPRIGKYGKDGRVNPMPGSSMPMAVLGVFMLWLGWFGFNGGSVLSADPGLTSLVLVTTCLGAAAGGAGALIAYSLAVSPKPDLSMMLNGILAGLVGITAGADVITPVGSIIIGSVAGVIVVGSVLLLDKVKIDDPVGAVSVHLVCGIWGTVAVGIFSTNPAHSLATQLLGVGAYGVTAALGSAALFFLVKLTMGLRVSEEEEVEGLDSGEHGMRAYDFLAGIGGRTFTMPEAEEAPAPAPAE